MENFSADHDRGWKVINERLATTDYYVLVLAGRYGSIDESIGMSWTEREYCRAIELGIPVLAFVRKKSSFSAENADTDDKAKRLQALIDRVASAHLRVEWTTAADLCAKVGAALSNRIASDQSNGSARAGWYRGSQLSALPASVVASEHAYLNGVWVDAAFVRPPKKIKAKGLICFGSRCTFKYNADTGSVTGEGENFTTESRLGKYTATSSKVEPLRLTYTFDWRPRQDEEAILGCGSLNITPPDSYGGYFFADGFPRFGYTGRRLHSGEADPTRAHQVVKQWMDDLVAKGYRFASPTQLGKWFR